MGELARIVFAGTPDFAAVHLQALLAHKYRIVAVYTQPDRPAGRGRKLQASPVKTLAQTHQLPVYQPKGFRNQADQAALKALQPDLMVVVAYGLLLPSSVLAIPRLGCINVHASLLPRWRGASPIAHAILAGDDKTGVTVIRMTAGLDAGPMLKQLSCDIDAHDTAGSLHDRLATLGCEVLLQSLTDWEAGTVSEQAQDEAQVTYAPKLSKQDGCLDWQRSAEALARQIRALNPWPVAYAQLGVQRLRIFKAVVLAEATQAAAGTIVCATNAGIDVATGEGILRLQALQFPGGKPQQAADLLNARRAEFAPGTQLTRPGFGLQQSR